MIALANFISGSSLLFQKINNYVPWDIPDHIPSIISLIDGNKEDYIRKDEVIIHRSAVIERDVIIKGPAYIGANCFVASHAYLRGGIILEKDITIGPGCEVKTSVIFENSHIAHFNFIGNSVIGSHVNFEAGSIIANYYNERADKGIILNYNSVSIDTGLEKFGAIIGDFCRIGANAVLSPGTLLKPGTVVKRLELIEQT